MKVLIAVLLFAAFSSITSAAPQVKLPTNGKLSLAEIKRIRQVAVPPGGCNARICFALDGSGSVSNSEFELQKNFVQDVAAIISADIDVELAAVQYGVESEEISPLTFDVRSFMIAVHRERSMKSSRTSITAGIRHCSSLLRSRQREANKIVLLGDGSFNAGGTPVPLAQIFRRSGGDICAVEVGFSNTQSLLDIVGGDSSKIFSTDEFIQLSFMIESFVKEVCAVPVRSATSLN